MTEVVEKKREKDPKKKERMRRWLFVTSVALIALVIIGMVITTIFVK